MPTTVRRWITHPSLALGSTMLWGVVEFFALIRSRWATRLRNDR